MQTDLCTVVAYELSKLYALHLWRSNFCCMIDCTFKQTYAVLDWQNKEQLPIKAPDNELFTVKYSEVCFNDTK